MVQGYVPLMTMVIPASSSPKSSPWRLITVSFTCVDEVILGCISKKMLSFTESCSIQTESVSVCSGLRSTRDQHIEGGEGHCCKYATSKCVEDSLPSATSTLWDSNRAKYHATSCHNIPIKRMWNQDPLIARACSKGCVHGYSSEIVLSNSYGYLSFSTHCSKYISAAIRFKHLHCFDELIEYFRNDDYPTLYHQQMDQLGHLCKLHCCVWNCRSLHWVETLLYYSPTTLSRYHKDPQTQCYIWLSLPAQMQFQLCSH